MRCVEDSADDVFGIPMVADVTDGDDGDPLAAAPATTPKIEEIR